MRTGEFLRGFEHWNDVDGALVRFVVCGMLHWLGLVDLAAAGEDGPVTAFRWSGWSASLLKGKAPEGLPIEEANILIHSDARLRAPPLAPRSVRYQLARFSRWDGVKDGEYRYRLTPASLERARQGGLKASHLLSLLRRCAEAVPPSLVRSLERWEERGSEARLENATILRVSTPELMQTLRASRASRFLGDPLGPTAVIVNPGAWKKVLVVLAELGYLGEAVGLDDE
jgi:hypothetical protein